jgi:hypothetical protein
MLSQRTHLARLLVALAVAAVAVASCGGQRVSTTPAAVDDSAFLPLDGDAGDCSDRARVRPLCVQVMTQRCRGQALGCESGCETQFGSMPGNSEKEPGLRGDIESSQCRGRCTSSYAGCVRSLVARCPETCSP